MTDRLRVILEIGRKRRIVAGAMDWPGLDRWGTSEDDALDRLSAYLPRYADVAERAGMGSAFARARDAEVVERVSGSSTTDFWGIAHVPSQIERDLLPPDELERRLDLLCACWAHFDDVAARVSGELRPGSRGGGRNRDQIIRHVYGTEPGQFSRKVEVRAPLEVVLTPDGLATHRQEYLDAIRAYNAEGRPARTWPIQFLVRRTAHHVMDHAWELEDRDLRVPSVPEPASATSSCASRMPATAHVPLAGAGRPQGILAIPGIGLHPADRGPAAATGRTGRRFDG